MELRPTDINTRLALLSDLPLFFLVPESILAQLATLFHDVAYPAQKVLVREHAFVDCVFIIVKGEAEVSRHVKEDGADKKEVLAVLHPGEPIGLSDTGFYSTTGARVATVKSLTPVFAIRLAIVDFKEFLFRHPELNVNMLKAANNILREYFIKQIEPFAEIRHSLTKKIAGHLEEVNVSAGDVIIKQGDIADHCYLLRSGTVDSITINEDGSKSSVDLSEPGTIFGEAALLTNSRNHTSVEALTDCKLFSLSSDEFKLLTQQSLDISSALAKIPMEQHRPTQQPNITIHTRLDAEKQMIVILQDAKRSVYFQTSQEGLFVWNLINGERTIKDISNKYDAEFNSSAIEAITSLIVQLMRSGFVKIPNLVI